MCLSEFCDIFQLFRKFKIWCNWMVYDVLNEVCNEVKVWLRHIIFKKGNIVLRLLFGCIVGVLWMRRS